MPITHNFSLRRWTGILWALRLSGSTAGTDRLQNGGYPLRPPRKRTVHNRPRSRRCIWRAHPWVGMNEAEFSGGNRVVQRSAVSRISHGSAASLTSSNACSPASGRATRNRKCPFPALSAAPLSPNRAWNCGRKSNRIGSKACSINGNSRAARNGRRYHGGLSRSGLLTSFGVPCRLRISKTHPKSLSAA